MSVKCVVTVVVIARSRSLPLRELFDRSVCVQGDRLQRLMNRGRHPGPPIADQRLAAGANLAVWRNAFLQNKKAREYVGGSTQMIS
jgi:hypothetical protein